MPLGIKAAVRKLQKIIRAVRSSLQRRQQWYSILSPRSIVAGMHMLIFDVRTRWSSTHQMMSTLSTYKFATPDTKFRTLILLKHHLHLKCKVLEDALQPTEKL
ncbi:hypothetical protein B0H19DRAFT_1180868 [Mycena capillaripes]|nr:hypothetical protein B0H19DRAFT_1180868 [Mycena capillaripes]